ncbi:hypothetical protein LUZ60_013629 [Juncus effusus]|nr:hypothetical protein LUZ60_013629 [Juncus effusus]
MKLPRSKSQIEDGFSEEEEEDNDWIIVKKQKINIIIPPLSPPIPAQIKSRKCKTDRNFSKRSLPIINSSIATRRFHASILERRIKRLGGIKKWLVSIGFERFSWIFEREKMSFYQLVGISVEKLKEIGVGPVGPRRKLIHSIQKLSQVY